MANRIQHSPPVADLFYQFSKLTIEIRLMIWEYTWPEPRLIEASLFDNPEAQAEMEGQEEETEEPFEIVNLRFAGSLSTMLKEDLGSRIVEDGPVEHCPAPVALQICQQSRMHTLSRYRVMTSLAGPFYYHPQRDVIFFSVDVADDYPMHIPFLDRYHKTELNTLETVLVLESEWPDSPRKRGTGRGGMDYTLDCISHLGGLKTVQIFREGSGVGSKGSSESGDEGEEEDLQALADHLRHNFQAIIEYEKCTATKIEVVDSDGKLY
ncbi:hypothetical protein B0O99DRAFT_615115 [Bisporella sp. PMI_857]|nr:hypothetical protein B0O99DRAFT_615115 [Bisporella sp. PMI_857]